MSKTPPSDCIELHENEGDLADERQADEDKLCPWTAQVDAEGGNSDQKQIAYR
jgi:hypothetical protein